MKWLLAVIVLVSAMGLPSTQAICGSSIDSPPATATATGDDHQSAYTLVEPGAEPRQALRYKPTVNQRFTMSFDSKSSSLREINGKVTEGAPFPISKMGLTGEVIDINEAGEITQRFVLDRFVVPSPEGKQNAALDAMRDGFSQLEGEGIEFTFDPRGQFVRGGMDVSKFPSPAAKASAQQLNQQLAQMSFPLPVEPVGVGAQWKITKEMTLPATVMNMTVKYTIKSIQGTRVTMHVAMEQKGLPRSPKSTVRETIGQTDGELTIDLTDMSKLSMHTESTVTIFQELTSTQPPTKIKNVDRITMDVTSKPADPPASRPAAESARESP